MPVRSFASRQRRACGVLGAFVLAVAVQGAGTALAEEAAPAAQPPTRVLSLNEAERAAVAGQPQLLVARAATAVAVAQADQARAPLLPQVTATAEYAREGGINAAAYESGKA